MEQEREKHWKMPADLKKRWIGALTSGEFKQSNSTLVDIEWDEENPDEILEHAGYCCLGVLAFLCGVTDDQMSGHDLPSELSAGNQELIPEIFTVKYDGDANTAPAVLAKLNDGFTTDEMNIMPFDLVFGRLPEDSQIQYSFEEIAQFIEDNFEGVEGELVDAFPEEQVGTLEPTTKEQDEINRLTSINDALNTVMNNKDEEIVILKQQLQYENDMKSKYQDKYHGLSKTYDNLHAKLWDITQALNAPVGWFYKSKRRLEIIERILTRKEQ